MWTCLGTRAVAIALICLVIALGLGEQRKMAAGAQPTPFWTESTSGPAPPGQAPDIADLVEHLHPAVVNIRTTQTVREPHEEGQDSPFDELRRYFGELPQRQVPRHSLGSGFLITKDGYIVTNNHVVENATDIKVALSDREEFNAKVIGRDSQTDVALIKIDATNELPVVPLGDSDRERVGGWVLAIGNPFGLGQTVTVGIISAKGRVIGAGPYDDFIQTDASMNPGNSGGPLFNLKGEVIGINSAIVARARGQGIGFATPINLAKGVLTQLRDKGQVTRGWVGVQVQPVTPELARSFGLDHERGALVTDVMSGSPAEQAGIQRGDLIVEFNGHKIDQVHKLPPLAEHIGDEKRGYYTGWLQTSPTLGIVLSLAVIIGTRTYLGNDAFTAWGWRLPFLISLLLVAVAIYIRLSLQETPIFQDIKAKGQTASNPWREAFLSRNIRYVLIACVVVLGQGCVWYSGQFWALYFLQTVKQIDVLTSSYIVGLALLIATPTLIFWGWLSDKIGRKPIILGGMLLASLTYYPLYLALSHYADPNNINYTMSVLIVVVLVNYVGMTYGPIAAFLAEFFPGRIRYTSVSVPYHIGNGWGGGLVPIITTSAYLSTNSLGWALAYPIGLPLLMGLIALFVMPETRQHSIWEEGAIEATRV